MITRFKLLAAAVLGLALASGSLADASASTVAPGRAPAVHAATSGKIHRVSAHHTARTHRATHHAARSAKHLATLSGRHGAAKHAGRVTKRQHQAMAGHVGGKTTLTR